MNKKIVFLMVFLVMFSIMSTAAFALSTVTLNKPANNSFIRGTYVLNATTDATASNVTFYYTNSSGTYSIGANTTSGTSFTYSWDTTAIADGTYNITANSTNSTGTNVSTTNSNITIDNSNPSIAPVNPTNGSYISSATQIFQATLTEQNINSSINVSVFFRRQGVGSYQTEVMYCVGTAPTYNCNSTSKDLATLVGLSDGDTLQFFFNSTDIAGNYGEQGNSSVPLTTTLDTTDPVVNSINNYANNSYTTSTTVTFGFNVTDTNIDTCILYHNASGSFAANVTATSITSGADTNFSSITLSDGNYIWNVKCNDSAGRTDWFTNNYTLHVDSTKPSIALNLPANNSWDADGSITFNYTSTDTNLDTCILYHNASGSWTANTTNSSLTSGSDVVLTQSLPDGTYIWNTWCNDSAGNVNWSATNYTVNVDNTDPVVNSINNYANNSWTGSNTVTFGFNVTDTNIDTCILYHNDSGSFAANVTATSITSGADTNFSSITLSDGSYIWNVKCNDSAGQTDWFTSNYTLNVDNTDPVVNSLDNPSNNAWSTSRTVTFGFTATDNNFDTCILYHNASGTFAANETLTSITSAANNNFTDVTFGSDGNYIWNVKCNDSAAQTDWFTSNYTVKVDTTNPVLSSPSPADGGYISDPTSLTFQITLTETNINSSVNATVYYRRNNTGSYTSATMSCPGSSPYTCTKTLDVSGIVSNGEVLEYFFNTTDSAGLTGEQGNTSSTLTATVDTTDPVVNSINNYANNSWTSSNTVTFGFNVTDTNIDTCILYHNASGSFAANETKTSITSGTATNFTAITLSDGNYIWNVKCNDSAGRTDWFTNNYTLHVDSNNPSVSLNLPANNSWDADGSITFNYTPTDTNLDTCILYHNASGSWTANTTNSSLTSGNDVTLTQSLSDGTYIWNVWCNDSASNTKWANTTTNYTVNVDNTDPVVNSINNYANNSWTSSNTVTFGFNVTDTNIDTCILYHNDSGSFAANVTATSITSGADTNFSSITLSDGNYIWNVKCNDSAGQTDWFTNNYTLHVDSNNPSVSLNLPANNSWDADGSITFNYTPTDTNLDTCILYHNASGSWTANTTNSSLTSGNDVTLTQSLSDGTYVWNALCNDSAGNSAWASANYTINMDNTDPVVNSINNYANNSYTTSTTVIFGFNVTDTNIDTCVLYHNDSGSLAANVTATSITSGADTNFSSITLSDGNYIWNVKCNDSAGQTDWFTSNYTLHVDSTNPTIALNAPANHTWQTSGSTTFNYTPTDTNLDTCILYHNASGSWAANTTNSSLTSGSDVVLTQSLSDGTYVWNTWCNDSAGNSAWNSANYSLRIDATAPTSTMTNLSTYSTQTFTVQWSATDSTSGITTYDVQVNDNGGGWSAWLTDTSLTSQTYSGTNGHTYYFRARADDNAGNTGSYSANTSTTVSTSAPTITFYDNSYGPYNSDPGNVINITFSDTDGLDYGQYKIGANGTWTDIFSSDYGSTSHVSLWNVTWANLAEGDNTIYVRAYDDASNIAEPVQTVTFTKDTTNPTVSITSPTTGDTTSENITLSVDTSEDATCQYKTDSNSYADMAATGTTTHSQSITNLSIGSHNVTVNCTDNASNSATDSETWTVSTGVPTVTATSPSGTVTSTTQSINATTNEAATCKFDTSDQQYSSMSYTLTGTSTAHNYTMTGLSDNTDYTYYVRCNDTDGNVMTTSATITFTVNTGADTTAPSITATSPNGTISDNTPTLYVNISENGTCKFDTTDQSFANMANSMNGVGTQNHSSTLSTLSDGDYTYFIRCNDTAGNAMTTSGIITFTVDAVDETAPSITYTSPSGLITDSTPTLQVNTSENSTCKFDTSDLAYGSMSNTLTADSSGMIHNYTFSTVLNDSDLDGDYVYYVRCQDSGGNTMTVSSFISFVLDTDGSYNYTQWLYPAWDTLWLPSTSIMSTMGYTNYTITNMLSNSRFLHNDSYTDVYYYNGSTWTGYSPATGWAGSDLQYVNYTNDKPYWVKLNSSVVSTKTRYQI